MTDFHFSLRFSPDKIPALASKYNPKDDLEVEQIGKTAQERGFLLKPEFLKICA
ncbi:hypothetical protein SYK_20960 [Pseudodesulfovibrio nedwellii]|uniref:Uncharacterized protein n=1 Tax=Pseudodesulfovibrio nedwellii TaxID=2973072 RepID=A0ABN6S3C8_9BACT|nr:hypothetical protein [Pseudodesulfovibrio nedwellii]BDQ37736.1 hypothetical protein SYK_20960 [Pseudodesulfovibrio nedwellii]